MLSLNFWPLSILSLVWTCGTPVKSSLLPPPPSAQDYCLPVHRLCRGTGRHGSKCYPRYHRCKQRRHPWQHGPPYVSGAHSELCNTTETQHKQTCIDTVSVLCFHPRALSMVGLLLIALGTGGIKPCVAAFGGDQFQDHQVGWCSSTHTHTPSVHTQEMKTV